MSKLIRLCLVPLLLLSGCQVGPNLVPPTDSSLKANQPVVYGTINLAIRWPQKLITQGIPDSAQYIRVRIFRNGTQMQMPDPKDPSQLVDIDEIFPRRPAESRVNLRYRLPIGGGYLVEVRAYKDCPYKDVPTQDLNDSNTNGTSILRRSFEVNNNARIVAEGLGMNQTIRLPSFDETGTTDANNNSNLLTITLDQTVLIAGIGGSGGSGTPLDAHPGIDLGNGGNGGYPNYVQDARFRELNEPSGVFFDKESKDIYFCDTETVMAIRGSSGAFVIPTFQPPPAGNGDGGPAVDAQASNPASLVNPTPGVLYFWDQGNKSVRSVAGSPTLINNYFGYNTSTLKVENLPAGRVIGFGNLLPVDPKAFAVSLDADSNQHFYALDGDVLLQSVNKGNWTVMAGTVAWNDGNAHQTQYPTAAPSIEFNNAVALCARRDDVLVLDQEQTSGRIVKIAHNAATHSIHPIPEEGSLKPLVMAADGDSNTVYLGCADYIAKYTLNTNTLEKLTGLDKSAPSPTMATTNASNITVSNPSGMAYWGGKLYFTMGRSVYCIDTSTKQLSHFAGSAKNAVVRDGQTPRLAPLPQPAQLSADSEGVYIADLTNDAIYKVSGDHLARFAGGALPQYGFMQRPTGITYSKVHNKMYVTDLGKDDPAEAAVWEIDPITYTTRKVAGNPPGTAEQYLVVKGPRGVAADSYGNVYFTNTGLHTVCQIGFSDPTPIKIAGTGTQGKNMSNIEARLVQLSEPASVRVYEKADQSEISLFFLDKGNNRVCKLYPDTTPAVPREGVPPKPDQWNISVVAGDGTQPIADGAIASRCTLSGAADIDVDKFGNVYIAEGNKIWRIDRGGYAKLLYPRTGDGVGTFDSIAVYISDDGVLEIYFTVPGSQQLRKLYI